MGRLKKNNSAVLVDLVEEFFKETGGDVSRLTAAELGRYAESKGSNIKAYDIRRDPAATRRIEELKSDAARQSDETLVAAYRNTDVPALIRSSGNIKELEEKIQQLDAYWRKVDEQNQTLRARLENERGKTEACDRREKERSGLVNELNEEVKTLRARLRSEKAEREALSALFKKHVYPAVARELMHQKGLPVGTKVTIDCSGLASLIADQTPETFPGQQGMEVHKPRTRGERLVDELRKAALEEDGE